ncbi:MAG: DUF308 domain-containing protein [Candidatus Nanopelagicales bacterium]
MSNDDIASDVLEADQEVTSEADEVMARLGSSWLMPLGIGVVSIIIGILILAYPESTVRVAAVILGIWLLVSGVVQLVMAFGSKLNTTNRVLSAITGILGIILGIIAFQSLVNRIELLVLFIGLWWIMRGFVVLFAGAGSRTAGSNGWAIFTGVLGIIAGIVVLVYPIASLGVLVIFTGLWLIILGIFEVIAALVLRSKINKAVAGSQ